MSTAVCDESVVAAGDGWRAEIHMDHVYVAVDPAKGDPLPEACAFLFSPTQRRFWTIEYAYEDTDGWDVFLIRRIRPRLAAC